MPAHAPVGALAAAGRLLIAATPGALIVFRRRHVRAGGKGARPFARSHTLAAPPGAPCLALAVAADGRACFAAFGERIYRYARTAASRRARFALDAVLHGHGTDVARRVEIKGVQMPRT